MQVLEFWNFQVFWEYSVFPVSVAVDLMDGMGDGNDPGGER